MLIKENDADFIKKVIPYLMINLLDKHSIILFQIHLLEENGKMRKKQF